MNILDSSCWLEYLSDGKKVKKISQVIENTKLLMVPSISIYEVFKKVLSFSNENQALQIVALMQQAKVVDLDISISMLSAKLSLQYKLPLADSIMLASAKYYKATLWSFDSDFKNIPGVKYLG